MKRLPVAPEQVLLAGQALVFRRAEGDMERYFAVYHSGGDGLGLRSIDGCMGISDLSYWLAEDLSVTKPINSNSTRRDGDYVESGLGEVEFVDLCEEFYKRRRERARFRPAVSVVGEPTQVLLHGQALVSVSTFEDGGAVGQKQYSALHIYQSGRETEVAHIGPAYSLLDFVSSLACEESITGLVNNQAEVRRGIGVTSGLTPEEFSELCRLFHNL